VSQARAPKRRAASHAGPVRRTGKVLFSACLIVKDEEKTLPDCLGSLRGLVDEVVVYDTGSTDGTVELARRAGARVVQGYWDDDFGRARNASLEHCLGEWVLWIDADERFACDDVRALRSTLAQPGRIAELDALLIEIHNLGGDGSSTGQAHRAFRIFRRATCCWYGPVHEQVDLRSEFSCSRFVQAAPLRGARIDHLGYMDELMRERDKLARNLKLAEAALGREVKHGQEGIPQLDFGRALAAAGRPEEAQPQFESALSMAREALPRRAILLHITQNLLTLGRYEEVLSYSQLFQEACRKKDLAYYFEGVARRRLGQLDQAIELLERVEDLSNEDGFAFPDASLRAELAGALVEAGRPEEAAAHLVLFVKQDPNVFAMTVALKVFASTGKPVDELAAAVREDQLNKVAAALVLVPPATAGPAAEALFRRLGPRPELLAAAIKFAPALPILQAMEWSARLRAVGMGDACPLLAQARLELLEPAERTRAAVTAHAAFGDNCAASLAVALAAGVREDKLAPLLTEVNALDPALTARFAHAAAGPGAPGAGPVGTPEHRRQAVASTLAVLGLTELSAQIENLPEAQSLETHPVAHLAALGADR